MIKNSQSLVRGNCCNVRICLKSTMLENASLVC